MKSQQNGQDRKRLNTLMTQAFRQLRSSIYQGSSLTELTVPQLRTLFLLHVQETSNMSDISTRLGIGLPTVTNIVNKLEEKGLVIRKHDRDDRRVVLCSVSERGKAEIEQLWSIRKEQIAKVAESLSEEDLDLVTRAMEIILEVLNRYQKEVEAQNSGSLPRGTYSLKPPEDFNPDKLKSS